MVREFWPTSVQSIVNRLCHRYHADNIDDTKQHMKFGLKNVYLGTFWIIMKLNTGKAMDLNIVVLLR